MSKGLRKSAILWSLTATAVFAGDSSVVTSDGNKITGITAVAKTGDEYVGVRTSGGLMQVATEQLPTSFLKSWGISTEQPKEVEQKKAPEQTEKTYDLVKKKYRDEAVGGVMEYTLTLYPGNKSISFTALSDERGPGGKNPAYMIDLTIKEPLVDSMLAIIEKFEVLLNTSAAKPEMLGQVGANVFYYAPAGALTQGNRDMPNHEWAGYMIRVDKGQFVTNPYLGPDEVEMLRGFLVRYKAGEFKALVDP